MRFDKCDKIFSKYTDRNDIYEAAVYIENTDGSVTWSKGYNRNIDSAMNMASITKLFVTTCILKLAQENRLTFDDKISLYLDSNVMSKLHIYKDTDYSDSLTISDLLFQVSGLPDVFWNKVKGEKTFEQRMIEDDDYMSFEEMLSTSKRMSPRFEPKRKNRAYYADINFELLGKIIEKITGLTLQNVYKKFIFETLELKHTYVLESAGDFAPDIYYKNKKISVTNSLRSWPASGGGITTAREMMIFLKAFWGGKLFDKNMFKLLEKHNRLQITFGGIHYAGGYMYYDNIIPFMKTHQLIGHSGSTGTFAYYCPQTDLFFIGDINQASNPATPCQLLAQLEFNCR